MTDWIVIRPFITGSFERGFQEEYTSDLMVHSSHSAAISHGFETIGSDDFLVGRLSPTGRLDLLAWMDEVRDDTDELCEVSRQLCLNGIVPTPMPAVSYTAASQRRPTVGASCLTCEYFDGGGLKVITRAAEDSTLLHGDCLNRRSPRFETNSDFHCDMWEPTDCIDAILAVSPQVRHNAAVRLPAT